MSYQVLARKWRPRLFREMVGQTHVLQALINALDHNRLHHAYLFTGTRGVGKTTIARILAKCLNCEAGVSSEPCGVCSACREIDEGRFVDLIEVDAASRTKVEDTRELLDNVQYAPTRGRFKVYLIDEVHMLSSHSFNALLKTLEEPPAHVKFLLATTDPQKLPVTILSRCLQFSLKNMLPEKVVEHLRHVLAEEQVPFDDESLWLLGRAADGSMRDGLSLTDQAIAFGNGQLQAAEVRSMLGTIDHGQVFGLLQALATGDARALLAAVAELAEQGADFAGVLAELISTLQRVAIAQVLPEAADNSLGDQARVLELAGQVSAEDVQLFYQLALHGRRDLPLAPDPRGGFEMALLRMLAFRPGTLQHTGNAAPAGLVQTPPTTQPSPVPAAAGDPGKPPGISQAAADSVIARPTTQAAPVTTPAAVQAPPKPASPITPVVEPTVEPTVEPSAPATPAPQSAASPVAAPAPVVEEPTTPSEPNPPAADAPPEWLQDAPPDDSFSPDSDDELDVSDYLSDWEPAADSAPVEAAEEDVSDLPPATGLAAQWLELYPRLGVAGLTQSIAAHCQLVAVEGAVWQLHLDPGHSALYNENHRQRLEKAITEQQGQPVTLTVTVQAPTQETPAVAAARRRVARQKEAEANIQSDPLVQALINDFAAQICDDSIRPLDA
ncbi:DNA polymerase III subunit gamma/tau [Pseudomonas sp. G11-1]|uniref:DNA polymerase III subunit gamma/tau n=1 Tax=Halopseudomonas sp. SMJS2 TaxID=3041098 RepID=UPI0024529215|nr:DNA polymerase III subunit gamma/tau [Halopseudomonas sp. SMJS2]MCO5786341.1 DNA polymerase III subunit gamma/tau [Pseudomonas sp. G11-1]MCO5789567.1 DNA polymerase III subunit gamma/tau [Pseudomonas sp. G11-2]WGK62737.1 DNA polymerase III subunit gamma/tau [Halopseudomonas sp. SMJS2]